MVVWYGGVKVGAWYMGRKVFDWYGALGLVGGRVVGWGYCGKVVRGDVVEEWYAAGGVVWWEGGGAVVSHTGVVCWLTGMGCAMVGW